jgi:hypothetical protein
MLLQNIALNMARMQFRRANSKHPPIGIGFAKRFYITNRDEAVVPSFPTEVPTIDYVNPVTLLEEIIPKKNIALTHWIQNFNADGYLYYYDLYSETYSESLPAEWDPD